MVYEHDLTSKYKTTGCLKHLSWTAVFVGALVGVGLAFLLNLFSVAIGLSLVASKAGTTTFAVGGFIALLICAIVSMFVGGWTAGYLGRPFCTRRNLGVAHGFTAWVLALLITVLSIGPMSHYVMAYSSFITNPSATAMPIPARDMSNMPRASSDNAQGRDTTADNTPSDKTMKGLTAGMFIVFILFFVGALAACFGGHCGMSYRRDEDCDTTNRPRVDTIK